MAGLVLRFVSTVTEMSLSFVIILDYRVREGVPIIEHILMNFNNKKSFLSKYRE